MTVGDSASVIVAGRDPGPRRQIIFTGIGLAVVTTTLLLLAPVLGTAWSAVGGFLLLAVMSTALITGAYHAYRNAGMAPSLAPLIGVVFGVAIARVTLQFLGRSQGRNGLGTIDVAVVLLGIGSITIGAAYVVGLAWRG